MFTPERTTRIPLGPAAAARGGGGGAAPATPWTQVAPDGAPPATPGTPEAIANAASEDASILDGGHVAVRCAPSGAQAFGFVHGRQLARAVRSPFARARARTPQSRPRPNLLRAAPVDVAGGDRRRAPRRAGADG